MSRSRWMVVLLLPWLAATFAVGQSAGEVYVEFAQPLPAPNRRLQPLPTLDPQHQRLPASDPQLRPLAGSELPVDGVRQAAQAVPGESWVTDVPPDADALIEAPPVNLLHEFSGYRRGEHSMAWIVGNGDQFGMFSLEFDHYQPQGVQTNLGVGMKFHFLGGPVITDMPARVFDFSLAYQHRDQIGRLSYDLAASVMASSDFEGSSREGIRFPGHAVGFLRVGPMTELVFGVDYLDRGDVKLLPVGGLIVLPNPDVRLEVVFPRPRAVFRLNDTRNLFIGGELGGGTWAIERAAIYDDLATYRDLRLGIGIESVRDEGRRWAFEIAYLFDRQLEYTSGNGDCRLDDTVMIRLIDTF